MGLYPAHLGREILCTLLFDLHVVANSATSLTFTET